MQEREFRGKLKRDKHGWIYGDLTHNYKKPGTVAIHYTIDDQLSQRSAYVIPETVGQFTGKYDKNAVKIYEGDIITIHYDMDEKSNAVGYGTIKYCPKEAASKIDEGWGPTLLLASLLSDQIEVIGNKFDGAKMPSGLLKMEDK